MSLPPIHDHLRKLSDLTDSYRDLIAGTAAAHTSVVSNQQNVVMKQLTVISTIFLPCRSSLVSSGRTSAPWSVTLPAGPRS